MRNLLQKITHDGIITSIVKCPDRVTQAVLDGLAEGGHKELKLLLAKFYAKKSIKLANKIWDEKGLTDEDMDRWLHEPS